MTTHLITGDVHAHVYPGPSLADGSNSRLHDVVGTLQRFLDHADANKIPHIIIAGDLFHDRKGVRPEVLHRVGLWLQSCRILNVAVTILAGNHDLSIGGDGCTSVMALEAGARIVTQPGVIEIHGTRFGFIPYTEDPAQVQAFAKEARKGKATCVIGHVGLGDPRFSDCVPTDYEVPGRITVDDLLHDSFEQVFLGHYHRAQTLAGNVHYVGSPLQLSVKEVDQLKTATLYTPGRPIKKLVNDWSPRFHKMSAAALLANPKAIKEGDFVVATSATKDEAAQLAATFGEDGATRLRVERRVTSDVTQRINTQASETDIVLQYTRQMRADLDYAQVSELATSGMKYLQHAAKTES